MRFVHTTGKTWYKVLYQHIMHVISLPNISIKTNFKQITRVEIRLTNLYNTLKETTFCAWRHVICCRYFFCFDYVAYIDVFPTFQWYDVMKKIVRQRRSRSTSRHSFITTFWWYYILYQTPCIRQVTFFKFNGKRKKCEIKYITPTVLQFILPWMLIVLP
jgi:hypothetical protein